MPMKVRVYQCVAFAAFAAFAVYVALEPILAADDCISIAEILILLPFYAVLYFATLPALIAVVVWRIGKGRTMAAQRRTDFNLAIAVLVALLILEVLAYVPSAYLTAANRGLDFMPSIVLILWAVRIWLFERARRDARA